MARNIKIYGETTTLRSENVLLIEGDKSISNLRGEIEIANV